MEAKKGKYIILVCEFIAYNVLQVGGRESWWRARARRAEMKCVHTNGWRYECSVQ